MRILFEYSMFVSLRLLDLVLLSCPVLNHDMRVLCDISELAGMGGGRPMQITKSMIMRHARCIIRS
jgi:hypothetical protein